MHIVTQLDWQQPQTVSPAAGVCLPPQPNSDVRNGSLLQPLVRRDVKRFIIVKFILKHHEIT